MKTFLTLTKRFGNGSNEDDLLQESIAAFFDNYTTLKISASANVSQAIHSLVESSMAAYIGNREFMEVVGWMVNGVYGVIKREVHDYLEDHPSPYPADTNVFAKQLSELLKGLRPAYSVNPNSIAVYIERRSEIENWEQSLLEGREPGTVIDAAIVKEVMEDALNPRERVILEMRFGFLDRKYTRQEVGRHLGITPGRVREIEERALRNLRHPHHSSRLREAR